MSARPFAVLAALCGVIALAGWGLAGFGAKVGNTGEPTVRTPSISVATGADHVDVPPPAAPAKDAIGVAGAARTASLSVTAETDHTDVPQSTAPAKDTVGVADAAIVEASRPPSISVTAETDHVDVPQSTTPAKDTIRVADAAPVEASSARPSLEPQSEPRPVQVATASTSDPLPSHPEMAVNSGSAPDDCGVNESCIDQYLWSLYQRTPKVDSVKVTEQKQVTIKKKGKTRTVTKSVSKVVVEDFTWKDPKAAESAGMPLMEYVIGGMDRSFKLKLYPFLRALDDAGFSPGITSGFRDDYRQSLASGLKAADNRSYHGGSLRGGYGHGLAVDIVSVKGETRLERCQSSETMWKWVDANGKDFGIGRPYLGRDPPHVAPIDGKEYADHRGGANSQRRNHQARNQGNLLKRGNTKRSVKG